MIHASAKIHPSSIIEEGAKIGENVVIGPFCIVERVLKLAKAPC